MVEGAVKAFVGEMRRLRYDDAEIVDLVARGLKDARGANDYRDRADDTVDTGDGGSHV